jgi:single-strand DNA-binding protein
MAFNGYITGNLGRDPELKYLDSGKTVANFTLAVRQNKKDAPARWVKVAIWGKAAEYVGNYVRKGDSVLLMGRVEAPEVFTRRDGSTGIAEVFTADNIEKFGERQQQQQPQAAPAPAPAVQAQPAYQQQPPVQQAAQQLAQATGGAVADYSDDIPF